VNSEEQKLLEEARRIVRYLARDRDDPKTSIVAMHLERDLDEIAVVLATVGQKKTATITRKTAAARKRLAEDAEILTGVMKYSPKYSNIEFKCLDDYDKCRRHCGRYNLLCILSYIVCIGRRIVPLVPPT
jgi:hypothetical protein